MTVSVFFLVLFVITWLTGPATQALFLAAYGAARWSVPLTVVTVGERGRSTRRTLDRAREYLDRYGLDATYVQARGQVAATIVETAEAHGCDGILMGSYGFNRWLETALGGVVEQVLQRSGLPACKRVQSHERPLGRFMQCIELQPPAGRHDCSFER